MDVEMKTDSPTHALCYFMKLKYSLALSLFVMSHIHFLSSSSGKKFSSPVELVHHHSAHLDGFLTLARIPLDRLPGETPLVLHGISSQDLEDAIRAKAVEMGYKVNEKNSISKGSASFRVCARDQLSAEIVIMQLAFAKVRHAIPIRPLASPELYVEATWGRAIMLVLNATAQVVLFV